MIFKFIIVLFLAVIVYCLGSGLYFLVKEQDNNGDRVVKALTWRIALSFALFILLFVAFAMGWIAPHTL